ncbi:MAG: hypothetical protein ACYC1L_00445 [Alphaproteobacteria bacterium]
MVNLSEQELNRYSISVRDFEKSKDYVCAARKHPEDSIEREALLFAAIVAYYRPFSPNEKGDSKASCRLRVKDFGPLTEVESEFHQTCEKLRNKALAHSEFTLNPTKFDRQTEIFSSRSFSLLNENIDLNVFCALLDRFINFCHHRRADFRHQS